MLERCSAKANKNMNWNVVRRQQRGDGIDQMAKPRTLNIDERFASNHVCTGCNAESNILAGGGYELGRFVRLHFSDKTFEKRARNAYEKVITLVFEVVVEISGVD